MPTAPGCIAETFDDCYRFSCSGELAGDTCARLLEEPVDLRGQDEIILVQPADLVRPERQVDFVPVNGDVGMVALLLRDLRDAIDELDGLLEILELEAPVKAGRILVKAPAGRVRDKLARLRLRQRRHAAAAGNASLCCQISRVHEWILSSVIRARDFRVRSDSEP